MWFIGATGPPGCFAVWEAAFELLHFLVLLFAGFMFFKAFPKYVSHPKLGNKTKKNCPQNEPQKMCYCRFYQIGRKEYFK